MPQVIVTLGDNVVKQYVFDKDIVSIGRSRDNDIVIENRAVSRSHARIRHEGADFIISDLNSANGIYVNGERVEKATLKHDDVITIGKHTLVFKHEVLSDKALISDAFGAERTIIVDKKPVAFLVVTRGKQKDVRFQIEKAEMTIGSARVCDICLNEWFVSKHHAVIHRQGNSFMLRDVGSWRGTRVNDVPVTQAVLRDGDEIQVGGTRLVFHFEGEEVAALGAKRPPLERAKAPLTPIAPPRAHPTEKAVGPIESPEEEEPIRAGGAEDFIVPTAPQSGAVDEERVAAQKKESYPGPEEYLHEEFERMGGKVSKPAEVVEVIGEPAAFEGQTPGHGLEYPKPRAPGRPEEPGFVEPRREAAAEAPSRSAPPEQLDETRVWEEALKNKSAIIRKQAARRLKKLTGRDYDY